MIPSYSPPTRPGLGILSMAGTKSRLWLVSYLPVPVRATLCGLPGASSVNIRSPVRVPVRVGVNDTFTSQLAPAATVPPLTHGVSFLVSFTATSAKSPEVAIVLMLSAPVALIVRTTFFAAPVATTATLPHFSDVGASETCGLPPPPRHAQVNDPTWVLQSN